MSIKSKLKKALATAACVAAFLNPTLAKATDLEPQPTLDVSLEDKLEQKIPQQDTELIEFIDVEENNFDWKNYFIEVPLNSLSAFVTTVLWHELVGHALTAKYMGCKHIEINGPDINKQSFASVTVTNSGFTKYERNLFHSAGVEATSALSHLLYQGLKKDQFPEDMKQVIATTSLFMIIDRHRYIWSTAIKNYSGSEIDRSNDFKNVMTTAGTPELLPGMLMERDHPVNGIILKKGNIYYFKNNDRSKPYHFRPFVDKKGDFRKFLNPEFYFNRQRSNKTLQRNIDLAYGVALTMSAVELGLRWKEIFYLTETALGGNPKAPEGYDVLKAGFYPIEKGFLVSVDGTW
ncbi:hypothetical protein GOV03_05270 [Candidatus Woesearchaeota archaeon]|nr:hypothetical protein [Candidatus Woesearchaeota archaeon]